MILAAASFILLEQLPVNFGYVSFALLLLLNGVGMGLSASPNRAGVMNSLSPRQRGAGAGMNATFQNSAGQPSAAGRTLARTAPRAKLPQPR